jgi:hypothetical protein
MGMIRTQLYTGVVQPQCEHHQGNLFYRETRVCHQVHAVKNGRIQVDTPSLPLEVVGNGIRYCDISCAHCLSEARRKRPI